MKVQIDNRTYKITFVHSAPNGDRAGRGISLDGDRAGSGISLDGDSERQRIEDLAASMGGGRRITQCTIAQQLTSDTECGIVTISRGFSICQGTDTFDKAEGRRRSLLNALRNGKFSLEDRVPFYKACSIPVEIVEVAQVRKHQIVEGIYGNDVDVEDNESVTKR